MSKWDTLMERWILSMKNNLDWRKGQALMNTIYEVDRELSSIITKEYIHDCYYLDDRIGDTLAFIAKYYEVEGF